VSLYKVEDVWHYDFWHKGRRYKASTRETKKTRAAEVERARKDEVRRGVREIRDIAFSLPEGEKADANTYGLCEQYIKVHAATKKAPEFYEHTIRVLKRYFKQRMLSEIAPADVDAFMAERRAAVTTATANRSLVVLKHMLKLAIRWEHLRDNPAAGIRLQREPRGREVFLTPEQGRALLSACPAWLHPVVLTALYTGGRMGELVGLQWDSVDLDRGLLRFCDTKNGEDRTVPIGPVLIAALKGLPSFKAGRFRGDGAVFLNKSREPLHRDGLIAGYRRAVTRAGLSGVRFHDLRHTAASWWVQKGIPLNTVRVRLGHKSLAMTIRYAHLAPNHQDECNAAVEAALSESPTKSPTTGLQAQGGRTA
jgi:integrase